MYRIGFFLFFISLFFYGCGPSGDSTGVTDVGSSDSKVEVTEEVNKKSIILLAERGPVFKGTVTDAKGVKAYNLQLGLSNQYQFLDNVAYPVTLKGGYIDMNRDGKIDNADTKLDIEMLSYFKVISPLTTVLENNDSIIELLSEYYPITKKEITEKVPSETSINAVVLSNAVYKALKGGFKIDTAEFSNAMNDVIGIYREKFSDIKDLKKLAVLLEKEIVKIDDVKKEATEEIEVTNSDSEVTNPDFNRVKSVNDNIQDIWNITLKIPKNTTVKDFDIGITFVKESSKTEGAIAIRGISIENDQIVKIDALSVWGRKTNGSESSVEYSSKHDLTKNSLSQGDGYLLIKLGYIMENQDIVSSTSFKNASKYSMHIYVTKLNIGATTLNSSTSLQISVDEYLTFPAGTQIINGQLEIKGE